MKDEIIIEDFVDNGAIELEERMHMPVLENLTIIPSEKQQVFKSKNDGFNEVVVEGVEGDELTIIPTTEEQINEGLFEKVIVKGIEGDELTIIPTKKEQASEGLFEKVIVEPIPEEYIIPEGTIDIKENGDVDVSKYANANINVKSFVKKVISKGVDFIDYDGTLLYSYTVEEVQQLTELPELPEHKGLVCQGWNWSLEDIKEHNRELIIGATYITDDGKTRLYIQIADDGRMDVPIAFRQSISSGVEVDWGDGSPVETFEGKNTNILPIHQYSKIGYYVITLNPLEDCQLTLGMDSSTYGIMGANNSTNRAYQNMLKKLEIGKNVISLSRYVCENCYSLSMVTIPNNIITINYNALHYCYSLLSIIFPSSVTSIESGVLSNCNSLVNVSIPNSVTNIGGSVCEKCYSLQQTIFPNSITKMGTSMFTNDQALSKMIFSNSITSIDMYSIAYCYSLTKLTIPSSVTSISRNAFLSCGSMKIYDFSTHTQVPALLSSNAFNGIPDDCIIIFPDELYDEVIAATNWSTYADHIVKKSEVA